ncbi:S8 family serine peptidase [Legionella dresdenensis]|uniref:S8 family serine peptidase n=1 Tax=Legionella dresdenensis TaxID=450200 RepID=A0ABV8CF06_9GAMM
MRYHTGLGLALFMLAQAATGGENQESLRVIVKSTPQAMNLMTRPALEKQFNIHISTMTPIAGGAYVIVVNKPKALDGQKAMTALLKQLNNSQEFAYAVEDRKGHFKPVPQPQSVKDMKDAIELSHYLQWDEFIAPAGVMLESAAGRRDGAWMYTTGEATEPVVVAVLDTGIATNPAIYDNLVKDENGKLWGWNFAANNRDIYDETGSYHGTHVSGTIAGFSREMTGIGQNLKVLPVKIPDASGMFYESQVINGIYWSVGGKVPAVPDNIYPAKVLNMSFGVDERPGKEKEICDPALQDAVDYARAQGAVLMAAAGNDNRYQHFNAPAACERVMVVAATGPEGLRSYYSNYGPGVSFAAPGGDLRYGKVGGILSTVNEYGGYNHSGFDFYQGTSMATPHAAGIAGLIYAITNNQITPEQVEQLMLNSVHPFGESSDPDKSCKGRKSCGKGILDADKAVRTALSGAWK